MSTEPPRPPLHPIIGHLEHDAARRNRLAVESCSKFKSAEPDSGFERSHPALAGPPICEAWPLRRAAGRALLLPQDVALAANDELGVAGQPADRCDGPHLDLSDFRAEVAPLLAVLGYHLAAPPAAFVDRRKAPRAIDRLAELDAQIALHGDPSGLRFRLRRLLLREMELLGVVGRRREDRPLAEVAARVLRG